MALDPDKEKAIIDECKRLGDPLPDRIANAPTVPNFMELYVDAFFDLSTDRQIGFGEGPIPHRSITDYCSKLELDYDEERDFIYFIRLMDSAYLKYREKQSKKKGK